MNIKIFENMLKNGTDNALLRYSLGNEYLKKNNCKRAITHLKKAIQLEETYSAAWKAYAKALSEDGQYSEAIEAYEQGIHIAKKNSDIQIAKEMQVFLNRIRKLTM